MSSIEISKEDLIKGSPQSTSDGGTDILKGLDQVSNIFEKVLSMAEKGDRFTKLFGRPPSSKEEMQTMRPTSESLPLASQQQIQNANQLVVQEKERKIKELEDKLSNLKHVFKVDEAKLDEKITELLGMLDKLPPEALEMKVSELITLKDMFKLQIKKYIMIAIPEVVNYE